MPQYQKTVLKARYVQLMVSMKPVYDAWQSYYLANGKYTKRWEELDIELPGTVLYGDRVKYGDYLCRLYVRITNTDDSIVCSYTLNNTFLQYRLYPGGKRRCLASVNWDTANEVCKSLGAELTDTNVGGTTNYYKFPN